MGPIATGLGEVFHYVVHGEGKTLAELRAAQDWILAPGLRAVPGVAEVNSWGGEERQIQVVVDPAALSARGLGLDRLREALERANLSVGGGVVARAASYDAPTAIASCALAGESVA